MKKSMIYALTSLLAFATLTGCGGDGKKETSGAVAETGKRIETEYGSVSLMKGYDALVGEQTKAVVDEATVESRVQELLESVSEYKEVGRGAKENDYVYLTMTLIADGELVEDYSQDPYGIILGDQEYGEEFDQKIMGLKVGDRYDFTIDYTNDANAYYGGSVVEFSGEVDSIEAMNIPDLSDDLAVELGYESIEDMKKSLIIEEEMGLEDTYIAECKASLMQKVMEESEFGPYQEETFQKVLEELKQGYSASAEMFGMELGELLESFYGMKEEDLETEAMNTVHRYALELAIAQEQELMVTDEDYDAGLEAYAEEAGYESAKDMVSDYGEETIRFWLLEDKVVNYLYEHASITEVEPSAESETNEISERE